MSNETCYVTICLTNEKFEIPAVGIQCSKKGGVDFKAIDAIVATIQGLRMRTFREVSLPLVYKQSEVFVPLWRKHYGASPIDFCGLD